MINKIIKSAEQDKTTSNQEAAIEELDSGTSVLQFKVQLKHAGSPVWRRIQIPDNWTFAGLHAVIQAVYEWQNLHPHNFVFGNKIRIESAKELEILTDTNPDVEMKSEDMTEVAEIFAEYDRGIYTYDFNENWEHDVIFEHVLPSERSVIYPRCIKAKGAAPSDDSFELVEPDLDEINIRLALLVPRSRLFQYMNPYEWRLRSCLTRQKMLNLRAIGRFQKTQNWSKMNKDSLIDRLKKDIVDSIKDFMQPDDNGQVGDLQLMAYLLATHKPELPFEAERYQACFKSGQKIGSMIQELNNRGYLFELGGLDFNQLPAAIRKSPEDFYPVLVMPIEIKRECLRVINDNGTESTYRKKVCIN